jgi:hypothetical protein
MPSNSLKKLLLAENAPYLLSLLFICLGWTITYLIDKTDKLPVVEYDYNQEKTDTSLMHKYTITNISNTLFKDLSLSFININSSGSKIINVRENPIEPTTLLTSNSVLSELNWKIPILNFQPRSIVEFYIETEGKHNLKFRGTSSQQVILLKKSPVTFIIRNYIYLLFGLFFFWAILICIYLRNYSQAN